MQKLKHEGDIGGNQGSKHLKSLLWEQKHSYKQQKKEMHYLCMPFQPLILGHNNMRSIFRTKITKMFLKRKMQTHYLNIGHMIVRLIWRKERNPHLDPSITCHMTNFQHFENTSMKILRKGSFNIPNLNWCSNLICQEK